jgi:hypothetical protein
LEDKHTGSQSFAPSHCGEGHSFHLLAKKLDHVCAFWFFVNQNIETEPFLNANHHSNLLVDGSFVLG